MLAHRELSLRAPGKDVKERKGRKDGGRGFPSLGSLASPGVVRSFPARDQPSQSKK